MFDWLKNGKPYRQGAKDGRLVFETAMMEDGGEYQCVVVNDRGRVESIPVRLTVGMYLSIMNTFGALYFVGGNVLVQFHYVIHVASVPMFGVCKQ